MHLQLNEDVSILFACLFACCGGNRVDIVHKAQHERAERKMHFIGFSTLALFLFV